MKVYVFPADTHGCGHYRLIWPADVLAKRGVDVVIVPPHNKTGFLVKVGQGKDGSRKLVSVNVPEDADVIVLQRPAHPLQPQMIKLMRAHGKAVVVDIDDDMSTIHPNNVAYHTYRPTSDTPYSWRHAAESCREATLVTTSTTTLQRIYARHGRGMVLDNYVPAVYLEMPGDPEGELTFGWAGTTKSHPNDLQVTGKVIQRLIDEGHTFRVVGGKSSVKTAAKLRDDPVCTGSIELQFWAATIARTIGVGMVPLAGSTFNASKSRLKGIEYMATGVPWVASPRQEYRRLVKESGCGLLADTPKDWYGLLKQLLTDETLRKEQAEAGREWMRDQTYEANAWRWQEAWTRAYETDRR